MNDIIKNIEAAQLKEQAPEFRVGDTVKVTYTGEISEVDPFNGTVISVEKQ